ncbi:MAG: DUF2914 domain-containing protein [Planctomycetota bacterium]|jgi:hypothetical protein
MKTKLVPTLFALALLLAALTPTDALAQNEISIELVTATDVVDRQPVGVADTFPSDVGKVYAWMRVTGAADQAIQVVWSYGDLTFNVPLEIGGSHWRTWSSKIILPSWTGEWTVEVLDAQGNSITGTTFTIEG